MPNSDLRLDILGASFSITADEESAYLDEVLSRYRRAVEETQARTGLTDPLKTAILTGFLLCDEIHKLKNREGGEAEEAEALTRRLIARIDEALGNNVFFP
ncbi:MAG: cell division protein ZapA [Treponema sp.]|nr:cell division protein ZapA [Treponema sp.]